MEENAGVTIDQLVVHDDDFDEGDGDGRVFEVGGQVRDSEGLGEEFDDFLVGLLVFDSLLVFAPSLPVLLDLLEFSCLSHSHDFFLELLAPGGLKDGFAAVQEFLEFLVEPDHELVVDVSFVIA